MTRINRDVLRSLKSLAGPFESFDTEAAPGTPDELFFSWLQIAIDRGIQEAHAMTLSTVDRDGFPDARVLILKNVDEHGWHFAITRGSPKGQQIDANPHVALTFYWQPLGRQVRMRGTAHDRGPEVRAADFLARPRGSRASGLLARQSDVLLDERELDIGLMAELARIDADPDLVAANWAVYAVVPHEVEFWQGNEQRRHTRLRYRRTAQGWTKERLWP